MALRDIDKDAIEQLMTEGLSAEKIAEFLNCHVSTVRRYVAVVRNRDGLPTELRVDVHPHMYAQGVREAAMDMYTLAAKLLKNPRIPYDLQVEIRKALDEERVRLVLESQPHA